MGYLGLTQTEFHEKLGCRRPCGDRKSALRVFTWYYPIVDWEYTSKVASPENGEDVYTFKRDGVDVRLVQFYVRSERSQRATPCLFDSWMSNSTPVALSKSLNSSLNFKPSDDAAPPVFRSNIMLLLFSGKPG